MIRSRDEATDTDVFSIATKGIVKRFGDVVANDGVDLEVKAGHVHAVLGENGAGKSTLMNILAGFYKPDEGSIDLDGKPYAPRSPADALRRGLGIIHQEFQLVPTLTVTENIALGTGSGIWLRFHESKTRVVDLSKRFGLDINPTARVQDLSVGERQRVEILRMLYREVRILIMDEPTAVLTPPEVESLFRVMRQLCDDGCTILFITHKLEEVLTVSDAVTVMRRGKVMSTFPMEELKGREGSLTLELARMMVGREVILDIPREDVETGAAVLEVDHLWVKSDQDRWAVKGMSFSVHRGEVVGILGVAGNGQRELVEALVGLRDRQDGTITIRGGKPAYVPEDRKGRGTVANLDLAENIALTDLDRYCKGPLIDKSRLEQRTRSAIDVLHMKATGPRMAAGHLSGGTLQKLILARELGRDAELLIAEQPTRGLDISATEDVWQFLLDHRKKGGVLLITSDIREVLSLADRVLVIFRGEFIGEVATSEEDRIQQLGPMMAGLKGVD